MHSFLHAQRVRRHVDLSNEWLDWIAGAQVRRPIHRLRASPYARWNSMAGKTSWYAVQCVLNYLVTLSNSPMHASSFVIVLITNIPPIKFKSRFDLTLLFSWKWSGVERNLTTVRSPCDDQPMVQNNPLSSPIYSRALQIHLLRRLAPYLLKIYGLAAFTCKERRKAIMTSRGISSEASCTLQLGSWSTWL